MASETIHKDFIIAEERKPSGRLVKPLVLRTATNKCSVKIKFQYETSTDILIIIIIIIKQYTQTEKLQQISQI